MSYSVKEVYYTIHGEGHHAGQPAVFVRFAGCNLWTGLDQDRAGAICDFCDTDFVGTDGPRGGTFGSAADLAALVREVWAEQATNGTQPYVVCTGGEPLLQVDDDLVTALHAAGSFVHVETNGTKPAPAGIDWLCVSPKAGAQCVLRVGQELKLVYPQTGIDPADWIELPFDYHYLQPMDGASAEKNTQAVVAYCLQHPRWRVSLQLHKFMGIR